MSPLPRHIPLGKKCLKAEKTLQKIAMRCQARKTTAFRVLRGSYERLKKERGVNFHTLHKADYTVPMMMDLGVPTHELIIGYAMQKEGLNELTSSITKMFHANDSHYKKLNFRTLVNQGIPLEKLHECKVQMGILLEEKFTKAELVEAGYDPARIDSVIKLMKAGH
jgi:hypothetical protein